MEENTKKRIEEKKGRLEQLRKAFQDSYIRNWIPNYLLTILDQKEDIDVTLAKIEQVMPKYCVPRKFATEELQSLDEGSEKQNDWRSLLFELSPAVRSFWEERYQNYINPNGKYQALLGFTDMRERFLGVSHKSSVELLYSVGWKPADTMCAYLLGMTSNRMYNLSPDAVREAVRMDTEAALRLLDKKILEERIVHHHPSWQTQWQMKWMEFLYLFCGIEDQTFLHMEHKTKKLNQQCRTILERLAGSVYERMELEKAMRTCVLLPVQEEPADIPDKKMEKKQKAALLKAFVCNYQWSCSDWRDRRDHPASRVMMESLLWGYYQNEELQKVFVIGEDGQEVDGKGEVVSAGTFPHEKYQIGLVHPEELMQSEREYWKKYAKRKKWKQPFSQLNIPAYERPYDLTAFSGKQTTQLFMVTAAGKWGLYQGSDKNQYMSYHMADLLHGYGAQLVFDGIWRGPEYGPEIITM